MISGSSIKDFVLITLDEYMSLLSLRTTKSETTKSEIANLSESFPQAILPNVDKRTSCERQGTNAEKNCTQVNSNSRLQAPSKRALLLMTTYLTRLHLLQKRTGLCSICFLRDFPWAKLSGRAKSCKKLIGPKMCRLIQLWSITNARRRRKYTMF